MLCNSLLKLWRYILSEDYAGYDPYDALRSPFFRLRGIGSTRAVRLAAQQVLKRIPFNLRPVLGIPKGRNPVTYGLCLQAIAHLTDIFPQEKRVFDAAARRCLDELDRLQSDGYSGSCWGYDFDWEARYASLPAFTPTVVATAIIVQGLFAYHVRTGDARSAELCLSACRFVLNDLNRTEEGDAVCFSYSPRDKQRVLNATLKGARVLAQGYSIAKDEGMRKAAQATVRFALKHQRPDGSWPYAVGDKRTWADNFHTGYVLDCLHEYMHLTGDREPAGSVERGLTFYREHFLHERSIPKYYDRSVFPVDSTAGAQMILTLTRFGWIDEATAVAEWMIHRMQAPLGFFFYQQHRLHTNRISYMRWSNAWMLVALAYLLSTEPQARNDTPHTRP